VGRKKRELKKKNTKGGVVAKRLKSKKEKKGGKKPLAGWEFSQGGERGAQRREKR